MSGENNNRVSRETSWLEFNSRVLEEADDKGNPLLERLKFIAIFSGNLDEFFMVRMAEAMRQQESSAGAGAEALPAWRDRIRSLVGRQHRLLSEELIPELARAGIEIKRHDELDPRQKAMMRRYFHSEVQPVLTPIGVDQSHPFPLVKNLGLELLVRLVKEDEDSGEENFAIIDIPSVLPGFVAVEKDRQRHVYVPVADLVANNLDSLLAGCEVREVSQFRVTRDMDLYLDEDNVDDLLSELQMELQKTRKRRIIRLEILGGMSHKSRDFLMENLGVEKDNVYSAPLMLDLKSFFAISSLRDFPSLRDKDLPPLPSPSIRDGEGVFAAIRREGSFMVHHPYESFGPVVGMLEEAASDPSVLAIKQTLYRVGGDSPVVRALAKAARNGKQVTVLIELKARFDEEKNIGWARALAESGAHVVYGIAGLKVHCKALLVIRKEENGICRYLHLSTGNYNESTAKLYTDLGLFSNDKALAEDVSALFNVITGFSRPPVWNKILVAPFNLRDRLKFMIAREKQLSTEENPGRIVIKANALIDPEIIDLLCDAASAGVRVDLVIRGVCGVDPGLSQAAARNIRVVSVLDRFLEHSRIYYFRNNGDEEYYVGSSDIMPRNLDRRIELLYPVDREELRRELDFILACALEDRRKGRVLKGANNYTRTVAAQRHEELRSQIRLYDFYRRRYKEAVAREKPSEQEIKVFKSPASSDFS